MIQRYNIGDTVRFRVWKRKVKEVLKKYNGGYLYRLECCVIKPLFAESQLSPLSASAGGDDPPPQSTKADRFYLPLGDFYTSGRANEFNQNMFYEGGASE